MSCLFEFNLQDSIASVIASPAPTSKKFTWLKKFSLCLSKIRIKRKKKVSADSSSGEEGATPVHSWNCSSCNSSLSKEESPGHSSNCSQPLTRFEHLSQLKRCWTYHDVFTSSEEVEEQKDESEDYPEGT